MGSPPPPLDRLGRAPGVLRLSLTARCNLACPYCCPDDRDPPGLLSLDQRLWLVRTAVELGVHTLRLTGGEPLLHRQLEALITALKPLRQASPALRQIALTSNGQLLTAERALALRAAGLDRLSLSLDGVDGLSVARMAGLGADPERGERVLERVLGAIDHARAAGFDPGQGQLKLNAVIRRGWNDDQLLPLAELARRQGLELRLIEFMDVGSRNGWSLEQVLPAASMVERISQRWPLEPQGRPRNGTASRWRYRDGGGWLAVVASVTQPFCRDCDRLRITADGVAYTCLFAAPGDGLDLRPWLRPDSPDEGLREVLSGIWLRRNDRYSEERSQRHGRAEGRATPGSGHAEMAYLGG
ncbi:MAG: GTP 3',8-cyclase MoaA [Synechococcaceae cyanobacterium]|jgi:cyclic pyranopterin phosphate synthase